MKEISIVEAASKTSTSRSDTNTVIINFLSFSLLSSLSLSLFHSLSQQQEEQEEQERRKKKKRNEDKNHTTPPPLSFHSTQFSTKTK